MQSISTIVLDIAKSVFQVHGVDAAGQVVLRRQLKRRHVLAFFQTSVGSAGGYSVLAKCHSAYPTPLEPRSRRNDSHQ